MRKSYLNKNIQHQYALNSARAQLRNHTERLLKETFKTQGVDTIIYSELSYDDGKISTVSHKINFSTGVQGCMKLTHCISEDVNLNKTVLFILGDADDELIMVQNKKNALFLTSNSIKVTGGNQNDTFTATAEGIKKQFEFAIHNQKEAINIDAGSGFDSLILGDELFNCCSDKVQNCDYVGYTIDLQRGRVWARKINDTELPLLGEFFNVTQPLLMAINGIEEVITGQKSQDIIYGSDGVDRLIAHTGDIVYAGEGNDVLTIHGSAEAHGGTGIDQYYINSNFPNNSIINIFEQKDAWRHLNLLEFKLDQVINWRVENNDLYIDLIKSIEYNSTLYGQLLLKNIYEAKDEKRHLLNNKWVMYIGEFIVMISNLPEKLENKNDNFKVNLNAVYKPIKSQGIFIDLNKKRIMPFHNSSEKQLWELPKIYQIELAGTYYYDHLIGDHKDNIFYTTLGNDFLQGNGGSDSYMISYQSDNVFINNSDANKTQDTLMLPCSFLDLFSLGSEFIQKDMYNLVIKFPDLKDDNFKNKTTLTYHTIKLLQYFFDIKYRHLDIIDNQNTILNINPIDPENSTITPINVTITMLTSESTANKHDLPKAVHTTVIGSDKDETFIAGDIGSKIYGGKGDGHYIDGDGNDIMDELGEAIFGKIAVDSIFAPPEGGEDYFEFQGKGNDYARGGSGSDHYVIKNGSSDIKTIDNHYYLQESTIQLIPTPSKQFIDNMPSLDYVAPQVELFRISETSTRWIDIYQLIVLFDKPAIEINRNVYDNDKLKYPDYSYDISAQLEDFYGKTIMDADNQTIRVHQKNTKNSSKLLVNILLKEAHYLKITETVYYQNSVKKIWGELFNRLYLNLVIPGKSAIDASSWRDNGQKDWGDTTFVRQGNHLLYNQSDKPQGNISNYFLKNHPQPVTISIPVVSNDIAYMKNVTGTLVKYHSFSIKSNYLVAFNDLKYSKASVRIVIPSNNTNYLLNVALLNANEEPLLQTFFEGDFLLHPNTLKHVDYVKITSALSLDDYSIVNSRVVNITVTNEVPLLTVQAVIQDFSTDILSLEHIATKDELKFSNDSTSLILIKKRAKYTDPIIYLANYFNRTGWRPLTLLFADNSTMSDSELAEVVRGTRSRERRQIKEVTSSTASVTRQPLFFKAKQWLTRIVSTIIDTINPAWYLNETIMSYSRTKTKNLLTIEKNRTGEVAPSIEYHRYDPPKLTKIAHLTEQLTALREEVDRVTRTAPFIQNSTVVDANNAFTWHGHTALRPLLPNNVNNIYTHIHQLLL